MNELLKQGLNNKLVAVMERLVKLPETEMFFLVLNFGMKNSEFTGKLLQHLIQQGWAIF